MPCESRCICAVCNCGRHKLCQPIRTVDGHIESHTEYCDNYIKYQVGPRQRGKAAAQQLAVGGDFYGSTENREKFKTHPVPAPPMRRAAAYHPNDGAFSSQTTQRMDFPAWPGIAPPKKKERPEWVSTSGPFEAVTTNRNDFKDNGTPVRPMRRAVEWVKPDTRFEGHTTQSEDYQSWPVPPRPAGRHAPTFVPQPDDREFKSTTQSAYLYTPAPRHVRPVPTYNPPDTKFIGSSTQHDDYQAPRTPVGRREDFRPRNQYVIHQDDRDFLTTMRKDHGEKKVPICPAAEWVPLEKERGGDGHVYLKGGVGVGA